MKKINLSAILLLALLAGCSQSASNTSAVSESDSTSLTMNSNMMSSAPEGKGSGGGGREEPMSGETAQAKTISLEDANQTAPVAIERKIIRNAELNLEVAVPDETQRKIAQIAENAGGFVVESTQSGSDVSATSRDTVSMTVRVPAAKFSEALEAIRQTGNRVIVETVKGEDVTEEFVDIEARLRAKKALEAQFLEIMKRANSVEDALNVQRELGDVRGEIEQIEGRKRFLENQASLSTIKVRLQTPTAFSANSSGFFYQLRQAFGTGFDAALSFILVLVTALIALLPFLVLIVLPIYLLIRYLLRKNRKQKLADEILREEIGNE